MVVVDIVRSGTFAFKTNQRQKDKLIGEVKISMELDVVW